jgi:hypothetical protein
MRVRAAAAALVMTTLLGCAALRDPLAINVDSPQVFEFGAYCSAPPTSSRSALSYARTGFGYVEQQCGIFFDKLAELNQAGRFGVKALNATSLGTQSILQAAKVAAEKVTIVASALTLSEAVLNAFVEQYALAPYLYKVRELTWQAFQRHQTENEAILAQLHNNFSADAYCDAFVLVQQHANICTLSHVQMLFDQQVAAATKVVNAEDKARGQAVRELPAPMTLREGLRQQRVYSLPKGAPRGYVPLISPNYTVQ